MTDEYSTPPQPEAVTPQGAPQAPPQVVYVQASPQKHRGFAAGIVRYLLSALVILSVVMNLWFLVAFSAMAGSQEGPSEKYIEGSIKNEKKVAIISIKGAIMDGGGGAFSSAGVFDDVMEQLKKAREDEKVVAVVLDVDSPGGTITASDVILHEVEKVKAADKRVVVYMGQLAASGGYYVSCKADRIYASPTTLTGSIGVVFGLVNAEGLSDKIGVKSNVLTRGEYKDMGSPWREMKPEERARFDVLLDDAFDRFKEVVQKGRGLTDEQLKAAANGSILTAREAKSMGLIDETGYLEDAIKNAKGTHTDVAVVRYRSRAGLLSALLSGSTRPANGEVHVRIDTPLPALKPGLYYMWLPGLSE